MIEFVTASHRPEVLAACLERSPIFRMGVFPLAIRKEVSNISAAYNSVGPIDDFMCYLHHDVFLPVTFENDLKTAIDDINKQDPAWGVLGVAGVKLIGGKKENFGNILDRGKVWAYNVDKLPAEVDTLDELLLITQSDFEFDENLPFDFYGADICMQAKAKGRKCYAIDAYCEHNSTRAFGARTESFYKSQEYFKNKWREYLPIVTTCAILEK